jgi:hypothetical protein
LEFSQDVLTRLEPNYAKSENIRIITNTDPTTDPDKIDEGSKEQTSDNDQRQDDQRQDNADGWYGSTGSREQASANKDGQTGANYNNNQENIYINGIKKQEVANNGNNTTAGKPANADTYVHKPSYPSYPSADKDKKSHKIKSEDTDEEFTNEYFN